VRALMRARLIHIQQCEVPPLTVCIDSPGNFSGGAGVGGESVRHIFGAIISG